MNSTSDQDRTKTVRQSKIDAEAAEWVAAQFPERTSPATASRDCLERSVRLLEAMMPPPVQSHRRIVFDALKVGIGTGSLFALTGTLSGAWVLVALVVLVTPLALWAESRARRHGDIERLHSDMLRMQAIQLLRTALRNATDPQAPTLPDKPERLPSNVVSLDDRSRRSTNKSGRVTWTENERA